MAPTVEFSHPGVVSINPALSAPSSPPGWSRTSSGSTGTTGITGLFTHSSNPASKLPRLIYELTAFKKTLKLAHVLSYGAGHAISSSILYSTHNCERKFGSTSQKSHRVMSPFTRKRLSHTFDTLILCGIVSRRCLGILLFSSLL